LSPPYPRPIPHSRHHQEHSFCRACGALVGIFPERSLDWQHYRGDGITSGAQEIYDAGHALEAAWCLPDEDPEEL
jgi:hypothetical protein